MNLGKRSAISLAVASAITVTSVLSGNVIVAQFTKLPSNADLNQLKIEQNATLIFDKNGQIVTKQQKEQKSDTKFAEMPPEIIHAILATEDREFYEHSGFNVKAIFRSALRVVGSGEIQGGGSTITQQLVKTVYLSKEQTLTRKIREALLATSLEAQLSKKEIIENYLNHIYYGESSYGVKDAIETYYGKSLEDFNKQDRITKITQAALLGGLPQLPSYYTPYKNPGAALARRNTVLSNMLHAGFITTAEYEQAYKQDFLVLPNPNRVHNDEQMKYDEISQYALEEAAEILNIPMEEVRYSGVRIYTSFDPQVYEILRRHFDNNNLFPAGAKDGTKVEGSAVFGNPQNGEILALTGGRDVPKFGNFNRAYSSVMKRQPGSTFKPIAEYGPALDLGLFTSGSMLPNSAGIDFGGGYSVKNASKTYKSRVSMSEALRWSYNVPAVYTLKQVGIKNSKDYLKRLGIDLTSDQSGLSMALGGLEHGVSPLQMADAYQPFANGGYRTPMHMIRRIVSNNNEVIYDSNRMNKSNRVFKEGTAEQMSTMLKDVVDNGTGQRAKVSGQFIAGKTGTTQHPFVEGAVNDVWFAGFSKNYVGAVWMGFDHSSNSHYINTSHNSAELFGKVMTELTKIQPDNLSNHKQAEKEEEPKEEMAPMNLELAYDNGSSSVILRWTPLEDAVYDVFKDGKKIASGTTDTSLLDASVETDKSYAYKVVAYRKDSTDRVGQTEEAAFKIPTQSAIEGVRTITPSIKSNEIALEWKKLDGITSYIIKRDDKVLYEGTETRFIEKDLKPGTSYSYQIFAKQNDTMSKPLDVKYTTLPQE